ncbi:IclR family transcriptional regulator [Timonella sp. A28]|uniref:IclR family transcriptional regulator n=1 Tax=Timonella sp. A28 TaxID=3442640 RepID=UPI003EB94DC5
MSEGHMAQTTAEIGAPPIESVDRALRILMELSHAGPRGIALVDVAAKTQMNKATVHRSLAALKYRAFATQDPQTGRYSLGGAAAQLGVQFYGRDNLEALLHPALTSLSARVGELVHLGVLDGTHIVYLDKVEPERAVRVFSQVGARVPARNTALGRAILMSLGLERTQLEPFMSEETGRDHAQHADRLIAELEEARMRGFAREIEENEPGISCVALPILRGETAVGAVSVTAPAQRMTQERMIEIAADIRSVLTAALPSPFSVG